LLSDRGIGTICERRKGSIGINGAKERDAARADVACAEGAFGGDLALDGKSVLHAIRNVKAWIKCDEAGRDGGEFGWCDRERGVGNDEAQEIDAIEVKKIGDGARTGSIVEKTSSAAKDGFTFGGWSKSEAEAWGEIVRVVMEEVLPIVAKADGDGELRINANRVFDKARDNLFEKNEMAVALLNDGCGWRVGLTVGEAGEGVRAELVREIVSATAADVRNVHAEIQKMLAVGVSDDVSPVEMIFGAAGISLCAPASERAGNDDLRSRVDARARLIVLADEETELIGPQG